MPKENTHICFAYDMLYRIGRSDIAELVTPYITEYLLGSFIPDTFFYSSRPEISDISEHFHGKDGMPTNRIIFSCLDEPLQRRDIALLLGFVTHCALDIVTHPVIYYLTGNYYDKDPARRSLSRYRHALFETGLDIKMGNKLRMHKLVKNSSFNDLAFGRLVSERFNADISLLDATLKKQLLTNAAFDSGLAHFIFRPLIKRGVFGDPNILGLFYREAASTWQTISDRYQVKDVVTGEEKDVTIDGLFKASVEKAGTMMNAVFEYYKGSISKDALEEAVPGENLSTGKPGECICDIVYTLQDGFV